MSMTGRWIDELTEKANKGDVDAQNTLRSAGLWETEEEAADREFEMFHAAGDQDSGWASDEPYR